MMAVPARAGRAAVGPGAAWMRVPVVAAGVAVKTVGDAVAVPVAVARAGAVGGHGAAFPAGGLVGPAVGLPVPCRGRIGVAGAVAQPVAAHPHILAAPPLVVPRRPDVAGARRRHHHLHGRRRRRADLHVDVRLGVGGARGAKGERADAQRGGSQAARRLAK